jgi:SAM-dependent methyltransferase
MRYSHGRGKRHGDQLPADGWPWPKQRIGARYMPTPQPVVKAMLALAQLSPADTVYDVGCGDGRVVITAARAYGAQSVGIDIEGWCVAESRRNARLAGVEPLVTFVQANALDVDLSPATVVTLYMPAAWNRLFLPKLRQELPPKARIVSYMYPLGDESPVKKRWVTDQYGRSSPIYLWRLAPCQPARPTDSPPDRGTG